MGAMRKNVLIDDDIVEKIKREARIRGVSFSAVTRWALEYYALHCEIARKEGGKKDSRPPRTG